MKKVTRTRILFSLILTVCFAAPLLAGDTTIGDKITIKKATAIDKIVRKAERFDGKTVRIEGIVTGVCKGSGCWFRVKGDKREILVKDPDHKILVPRDCEGRHAVVQGVVQLVAPPPAAVAKSASSGGSCGLHGKMEEKAQPHECPSPSLQIKPTGVILKPPT